MTGAHERWLFSTLFIGAKRVLTGAASSARTQAEHDEPTADELEDPTSGVRSREEVDEVLASSQPRTRTKTG